MITRIYATIAFALFALSPAAKEDNSLPGAEADKLSKSVSKAMGFLKEHKDTSFYSAVTDLNEDLAKLEKKVKFPVLADTKTWTALMTQALVPEKLPSGLEKKSKFMSKPRALVALAGKEYWLSLPRDYDGKQPVPAIVALPPAGDAKAAQAWAEQQLSADLRSLYVVVVPINQAGIDWTSPDGGAFVFTALKEGVLQTVRYDPGRIYLMGDGAVLRFACQYPSVFGGLIVSGPLPSGQPWDNIVPVPIFAVGAEAKALANALPGASGDVKLDVTAAGDLATLGEWLGSHQKPFYPSSVKLVTNQLAFTSAFWIQVTRLDMTGAEKELKDFAHIEARVDKDANEIVVTANSKVLDFTLYLNDDIIDFDRPIKVVRNDKVRFEGTRTRSIITLFRCALEPLHGNLGASFVDRIEILAE
ncbi:MAG: hypothetical protein AB1486_02670 [Planctomycetota bacterium]